MSDRFARPTPVEELNKQSLHRIEQALSSLVDAMSSLGNLPTPQIHLPAPQVNVAGPSVSVPTEGLTEAIVSALTEAMRAMPAPPTPQINLDGITADADLTPLVEAAQQQQAVMEALKEKIGNLTGGTRSHFDGRLRTDKGRLVSTAHPLTTSLAGDDAGILADIKRGLTDYETRMDYSTRTDDKPVYIGKATQGTTTATTGWTIQKVDYDGSDRITRIQSQEGIWDNRASIF